MKKTKSERKRCLLIVFLVLSLAVAANVYADITTISPNSAAQGTTDLTVTFTLDGNVPPADAPADNVTIGTISGTSVTRPSQYVVTAVFEIPSDEAIGTKDATVTFVPPMGDSLIHSMTDGFTVTVMSDTAPTITTQPQSQAVRIGNPVTLTVGVYGSTPLAYQWQKDGIDITDAINSFYTLDEFAQSDTGSYLCIISNDFGTATSDSAELTVNESANDPYIVVDTGQDACSDHDGVEITCPQEGEDYFGQDAQYDGAQMSYTDNGDGTVTDNVTGLMWEQTPTNTSAADGMSWQEAYDYCESLELAGYDDWRLPTTKELFSISDFTQGWPYLNTTYFDLAIQNEISKDEQYWADLYVGTTVEGGTSGAAFGVNHVTGHIKAYAATVSGQMGNFVRAVRGGNYGVNDFVDNGDGTITDRASGLMWQQDDGGQTMDWPAALIYAESATTAGYDDWRLPNVKELQSIVDYTKSPTATDAANVGPAIDTDYFDITMLPGGTTNHENDYGYYWTSTSAYFGGDSLEYYYAWYVAFGTAVDDDGNDFHGAGGARFDTKVEGGPLGEGGERYYNYVLLVRGVSTDACQSLVNGGDRNCDCFVNLVDFAYIAENWLATNCGDCNGTDIVRDGDIDFKDLMEFSENWLQGV